MSKDEALEVLRNYISKRRLGERVRNGYVRND